MDDDGADHGRVEARAAGVEADRKLQLLICKLNNPVLDWLTDAQGRQIPNGLDQYLYPSFVKKTEQFR